MYYKLIIGNNIIGIASEDDFRKYQRKHGITIYSDEDHAEYVEINNTLYHDNWLKSPVFGINYVQAQIERISKEEYDILAEAFKTNSEIEVYDDTDAQDDVIPEQKEDNPSLDFVKDVKTKQMSAICRTTIINGFDIQLSDGLTHHFSMPIEDQIKIQTLAMKAQSGQQLLPWHSDGELCVFYPAEDIISIYNELEKLQTFHTTYFNSLKYYIESLDTVESVNSIYYGINIPEEYQSEVLKYLLRQNNENGN